MKKVPSWLFFVALAAASCVPRQPPEPVLLPPPTPKILVEEEIVVPERPELAILDVVEEPGPDKETALVSGIVENRGSGRARNLRVTVQVLDDSGTPLVSLPAEVSSATVDPQSQVTFRAQVPRPRGAAKIHVVAESR